MLSSSPPCCLCCAVCHSPTSVLALTVCATLFCLFHLTWGKILNFYQNFGLMCFPHQLPAACAVLCNLPTYCYTLRVTLVSALFCLFHSTGGKILNSEVGFYSILLWCLSSSAPCCLCCALQLLYTVCASHCVPHVSCTILPRHSTGGKILKFHEKLNFAWFYFLYVFLISSLLPVLCVTTRLPVLYCPMLAASVSHTVKAGGKYEICASSLTQLNAGNTWAVHWKLREIVGKESRGI